MLTMSKVLRMESLYDAVYGGSSWKEHQPSRAIPHVNYRHIIRFLMYEKDVTSLKEVAQIEAVVFQTKAVGHDAIINSIEVTKQQLKNTAEYKKIVEYKNLLDEGASRQGHLNIMQRFRRLSHEHQLVVFEKLLVYGYIPMKQTDKELEKIEHDHPQIIKEKVETDELIYTEDQQKALEEIKIWFYQTNEPYKALSGFAGTGKTTLLAEIVQMARSAKVMVTATTNKAVKVLRDRVPAQEYSTIHSLLSIKPKRIADKEVFEPDKFSPNKASLADYDLVIIDEASMISKKLLKIIYDENVRGTKVLFCGDPAQLQPINEDISKCFDYSPATLTKIVRHGDIIARKAKMVRDTPAHVMPAQLYESPDIQPISKKQIWRGFQDFRKNPDRVRMLCYTNSQVDYWNKHLRLADYGEPTQHPFEEGDIVMANKPCLEKKNVIMANSEEGIVQRVVEESSYYALRIRLYNHDEIDVRVVKDEFKQTLSEQLKAFAEAYEWPDYWALKEYYHDIKHCYALTTHKSQGSTFDNVVLDWNNIQTNRDLLNRNQLIYVAMTRASKGVWIFE